jgi:transposase
MGHTDMRRGMPGLGLLVRPCLGRDAHGGDLFVFRGRSGSLVKMIWHDGMALCQGWRSGADQLSASMFARRNRLA